MSIQKILIAGLLLILVLGGIYWATIPKIPPPSNTTQKTDEQNEVRWQKPTPPSEGYTGSQSCAECHAELYNSFQTHPMAHALSPVLEADPLENYIETEFAPIGSKQYQVDRTESGVFHHEIMTTAEGNVVYDQGVEVEFAVGSGQRGRSYIVNRDGQFFQSPITWYSGEKKWALSPGYLPESHKRFGRRIVDGCIVCHSGRLNFQRGEDHHYQDPPFFEHSIGCENCHGPGTEHAAFHRSPGQSKNDPIVNPAKLNAKLRDDVCSQCHLQGEGRILRYGRTDHDFRPGMALEEIWVTFVRGTRADGLRTRAVSHVEQMHSSQCYLQSQQQLGCISCHDPHSYPQPSQRITVYRKACLNCHTNEACGVSLSERSQQKFDNSCIACHMPRLSASDVPHTTQTDHRILKNPGETDASFDQEGIRLFGSAEKTLTPLQKDRARGLLKVSQAESQKFQVMALEAIELLEPVVNVADDDLPVLYALGIASQMLGQDAQAESYWLKVLEQNPQHEFALEQLAIFYHDQSQYKLALEYMQRYLKRNPWREEMHGRHAHILGQLGRTEEGITAAKTGLMLNPSFAALYGWLSEAYERLNRPEQAKEYHEKWQQLTQ